MILCIGDALDGQLIDPAEFGGSDTFTYYRTLPPKAPNILPKLIATEYTVITLKDGDQKIAHVTGSEIKGTIKRMINRAVRKS